MVFLIILGSIFLLSILSIFIVTINIKIDEHHIVNSDSWHGRLYRFISNDSDLPNTVCSYFWKYVIYLLILPINIITTLFNKYISKYKSLYAPLITLDILFWLIVLLSYAIGDSIFDSNIFVKIVGGFLFIGVTTAIVISIMLSVIFINKKFKHKSVSNNKESLLKKRYKSFKEKHCPIIKWY